MTALVYRQRRRICRVDGKRESASKLREESPRGFTLLELVIVIAVILILAGLVLTISGYVQEKSKRARAETEIAAISAALESYKADNGIYPRDGNTDTLAAVTDQNFSTKTPPDPVPTSYNADPTGAAAYRSASFSLYALLSGNVSGDRATVTQRAYFQFKPNMLYPKGGVGTVTAILDPFGNVYGYSTAKAKYNDNPGANNNYGFNPTYDIWSTAGTAVPDKASYEQKWIKNW